ncbi:endonuclease/exonuclease/phosphatase [Halosimplex rubrum]|uniref:Endonuclease/exonuclease/phosphatase n=1 Tax=Halosimplex rubrum TaxID=869889 RepID=A0A7D5P2Q2_9EURY|nr:endonuclease/exonuclease/phosphatase family protein [Halosimplex rubrum]QLH76062.1 endonuclease/exonuclease/phosphatase [Halosimplex rubrum]
MTDSTETSVTRRTALKAGVGALGGGAIAIAGSNGTVRAASESHQFLWVNSWLTDGIEGVLGLPSDVAAKPAYQQRAAELGTRLGEDGYDIVGLAEVFNDEQDTVADNYTAAAGSGESVPGPAADGGEKGAGLLDLVSGVSVTDQATIEYAAEPSDNLTYVDAHVGKGVNYAELDLGPGKIDLFSTHLVTGSLLPWADSGDEDIPALREDQVDELGDFVSEQASDENVTVVAGDFNIEPTEDAFDAVADLKSTVGLYDAWETHGTGHGGTEDNAIFDGCDFQPSEAPPAYCPNDDAGDRIDYVFIEEATSAHAMSVTVEDIRRRVFWRELAPPEQFYVDDDETEPNYLTDHVGLDLSLSVAAA